MSRRTALPVLAAGLGLLTLAASILPFEARVIGLSEITPLERLAALAPLASLAGALALVSAIAAWRRPRHPVTLLVTALALGTASATATLVAIPDVVEGGPARVALGEPPRP